jgi:hypothetical protein
MVSIETINFLPDIDSLRKLSQSVAMLDAILCPEIVQRTHTLDLTVVEYIYDRQPLTTEIVRRLNMDLSIDDVAKEIKEIGYCRR